MMMGMPGMARKPVWEIMFDKYDTSKDGKIDDGEFHHLCFELGYALTKEELVIAIKTLDDDASGEIEKREFKKWWTSKDRWAMLQLDEETLAVRKEAADFFNSHDDDRSGAIDVHEFGPFHKGLVERKLTDKDEATCRKDLDANGDHIVQFPEYIDWLKRIGTIKVKVMNDAMLDDLKNLKLNKGGPKPPKGPRAPKGPRPPAGPK